MVGFRPPFEGRKRILLLYQKGVAFHERFVRKGLQELTAKQGSDSRDFRQILQELELRSPGETEETWRWQGFLCSGFVFCCFLFFSFLGHTDRQQEREPGLLGHMWFYSRAGGCFGGRAWALTVKTSRPGFPLEKKQKASKLWEQWKGSNHYQILSETQDICERKQNARVIH